ncbi:MAG: hypothetical protein P9L94_03390 [Candidatus Hinthialibacter antarcticus]|nr:hypothetical protein [Candidatus Hinthialibacter antarcticus]
MNKTSEASASPGPSQSPSWREASAWAGFFSLCTFALCVPVILNPSSHLADIPLGDKGTNLWNLWWVYYAVFERHVSPLWCDIVFYPQGVDLRFHTLSLANGLLAAPLTAIAGPNIAYNALFLLWTILTGAFASLWARGRGLGVFAAAFVGVIAAFSPYRFSHLIHLNLFSTACIFCAFWLCDRMVHSPNKISVLLFTLSWIWTALTDWYYAIFVGLYWLLHLFFSIKKQNRQILASCAVLPALCMGLLVYLYFFLGAANRPEIQPDDVPIQIAAFWSLDLLHLLCPAWALDWLPINLASDSEFRLHPGLLVMLFGAWGVFSITTLKSKRFLLTCAIIFFLISLGPVFKFGNAPIVIFGVPLYSPTLLYGFLPMVDSMRVFTRFAFIGFAILSLFAAIKIERMTQTFSSKPLRYSLWVITIVILILESGWRFPTIQRYSPPQFVKQNLSGAVQEFPYAPSRLSGLHLYHQTFHHQPIAIVEFSRLGGYRNNYIRKYKLFDTLSATTQENPLPALIRASDGDLPLPIEVMVVYTKADSTKSTQLSIEWPDETQQIMTRIRSNENQAAESVFHQIP